MYRHGVALVSSFSLDMWVPLWVTGVGLVLNIYIWSRVYYRVPDSAFGLYLVRQGEGPLLCAVLVAVVYCPKLAVMNTIMSLCMSGYRSRYITGITCYMLTYIPFVYRLSCGFIPSSCVIDYLLHI
jgi:hypothetical protein